MNDRLRKWRKIFLSALILVVIYSNCAIIINHLTYRAVKRAYFPLHYYLYDLFITFPVFTSFGTINQAMILRGQKADSDGEWIDLDVKKYFPFRMGERHARMFARKYADNYGPEGQAHGWEFMMRKIRERYNRAHPEEPIARVSIGLVTWPRSEEGYWAEQKESKVNLEYLYTEPQNVS